MSSTTEVLSHWNTLLENFQTSPQTFYAEVSKAIEKRKIPNVRINSMSLLEGSIVSTKRGYLRVAYNDRYFAICGAPFGTGFFVSWWLLEPPLGCFTELALLIPYAGPVIRALMNPTSYYKIDTTMMFQTTVHSAVLEVIDSITSTQGIKGLSEGDRKPIMREFFQQ